MDAKQKELSGIFIGWLKGICKECTWAVEEDSTGAVVQRAHFFTAHNCYRLLAYLAPETVSCGSVITCHARSRQARAGEGSYRGHKLVEMTLPSEVNDENLVWLAGAILRYETVTIAQGCTTDVLHFDPMGGAPYLRGQEREDAQFTSADSAEELSWPSA